MHHASVQPLHHRHFRGAVPGGGVAGLPLQKTTATSAEHFDVPTSHTWYVYVAAPFRSRLSTCSPSFGVLIVADVVPVRRTSTDVLVAPDHLSVTC